MTTEMLLRYKELRGEPATASTEEIEVARVMRGLGFAVTFSVPGWALMIFAIAAS